MATKLKLIKTTSFQANGVDHNLYVCAYKGKVFGVNEMYWKEEPDGAIVVDDNTVTINAKIEVEKRVAHDPLTGQTTRYLDIMPKCDLELSAFS